MIQQILLQAELTWTPQLANLGVCVRGVLVKVAVQFESFGKGSDHLTMRNVGDLARWLISFLFWVRYGRCI